MIDFFYQIYVWFYALTIQKVLGFLLLALFIWGFLRANLRTKTFSEINVVLLVISIMLITYAVLFRTSNYRQVYLKPFYKLVLAKKNPEEYREALMNAILFMPFGMTLPNLFFRDRPGKGLLLGVGVGFVLSIIFEALQYVFCLGTVETDDVISNTLGVLLGGTHILFAKLVRKLYADDR